MRPALGCIRSGSLSDGMASYFSCILVPATQTVDML